MTTHYTTLAVSPTATSDEIGVAFRRLARTYHPDIAGEAGAQMMGRINEAYDVLRVPGSRAAYDLTLMAPAPVPVVDATPSSWGAADSNWADAPVDGLSDRDTGGPEVHTAPTVDPQAKRTHLGTAIFAAVLLSSTLATLLAVWSADMVEMGSWMITVPLVVTAATIQTFKRTFGWKLTLLLALSTLCGPLGAFGVWGFAQWSSALGLVGTIAMTAVGPLVLVLRAQLRGLRRTKA